jgi:exonuclease SbcD
MVRIAHISDSHLGCSLFQLTERREDVRRCLKKAIEMAMKHSADVLVHTGDLFHSYMPQNDDMNFVIELFKGLKDKTILIVLQGNHDQPYGYRYSLSPLRQLETMELIISTGNQPRVSRVMKLDGKKVEIHLVSWAPSHVMSNIINTTTPDEHISLFFGHDIEYPKESLPTHFNYYGCGHKHNYFMDEEYDIGKPGSTCIVNWNKEMGGNKRLIMVDIDDQGNEYTFETLNDVREFKLLTGLDITGMRADEANIKMRESLGRLSPKKDKPIIIMQVNGLIDTETEKSIERTKILKDYENKLDPLFLHIEPNWQCLGPRNVTLSRPLDVEQSILEYMGQTKVALRSKILAGCHSWLEAIRVDSSPKTH